MMILEGKGTIAKVMTDIIDNETLNQIYTFINQEIFKGCEIVIMPDCHKGAGAVIGFTMPLKDFVIPNIIGVDIGCGIEAYNLGKIEIDFKDFDNFIRNNIPYGFDIRKKEPPIKKDNKKFLEKIQIAIENLSLDSKKDKPDFKKIWNSIGTLGGGNHFIEIDKSEDNSKWLVIHTGSRNFGKRIAEHYQKIAKKNMEKNKIKNYSNGLEYLFIFEEYGKKYIEDMKTAQEYAALNRKVIAGILLSYFKGKKEIDYIDDDLFSCESVKSIHNYINFNDNIIRKGAISSQKGERLIIPLNMRDGIIIGRGKGNKEWNYSAPHGAGRILSRTQAKKELSIEHFKKAMEGIWSSCINYDTIDEAPMAYKPKDQILEYIKDTIDIEFFLTPIYNFKAGEE